MKRCQPMRLHSLSNRMDHALAMPLTQPRCRTWVSMRPRLCCSLCYFLPHLRPGMAISSSWLLLLELLLCLLCNCKRLDLGSQCLVLNLQCAAGHVRAAAAFCLLGFSHKGSCCGMLIAADVRSHLTVTSSVWLAQNLNAMCCQPQASQDTAGVC